MIQAILKFEIDLEVCKKKTKQIKKTNKQTMNKKKKQT